MGKRLLLGVFLSSLFMTSIVFAKGFPKLGDLGIGEKKSSESAVLSLSDLTGNKDKAVKGYLEAYQELNMSLEKAAKAVDAYDLVREKLIQGQALKEGNINDEDLGKTRKNSEESLEIISQKMEEGKELSPESKKLMAESIVHLVKGIQKEKDLIMEVKNLGEHAQGALKSASALDKLKIPGISITALTLVKQIPQDITLSMKILSVHNKYAKAHNIEVPEDATNLLKEE